MANYRACNTVRRLDNRNEQRSCPLADVKVKVLERFGNGEFTALCVDKSSRGVGLLTYLPLPVGTRLIITRGGMPWGVGEIVNVNRGQWGRYRIRLGIRFSSKTEFLNI
jgi:hypothetical protein